MAATPLGLPPATLSTSDNLAVTLVDPAQLYRISKYQSGEPFFGTSGGNRFDAPGCATGTAEFATCYLGFTLEVAIAETLLHDEQAVDGQFQISRATLNNRYVYHFLGDELRVLDLTGGTLKRMGGHADLAGTSDYALTHQWAKAVFDNPLKFDGIIYMSRHLNSERAVVLFDRAIGRFGANPVCTALAKTPGFAAASNLLGIVAA